MALFMEHHTTQFCLIKGEGEIWSALPDKPT